MNSQINLLYTEPTAQATHTSADAKRMNVNVLELIQLRFIPVASGSELIQNKSNSF